MNILVIGSGGREHALCWAIQNSPQCDHLYCTPGNAGISDIATCIDIDISDPSALLKFVIQQKIDFVVVGPEAALVAGIVDFLKQHNIKTFGPTAAAATLEGSKKFMKDLCQKYDIPTAKYASFEDLKSALAYIRQQTVPIVIKADGLAAGKGVIIAQTDEEAEEAVFSMLSDQQFGSAGQRIVIEEFMAGEELSFFALADGDSVLPLISAQDHKAVYDGDRGPNTGGMGAYSPANLASPALINQIMDTIIEPSAKAMVQEGKSFQGVLYAGIMITKQGPKLLEYNVRFGDPECQVLMMRLASDIVDLLLAPCEHRLATCEPQWHPDPALSVVMANKGYPGQYQTGSVITLPSLDETSPTVIFHAGTEKRGSDLCAIGGRVLNITAKGQTLKQAQTNAYAIIDQIQWPEGFCRRDIGWRALEPDITE